MDSAHSVISSNLISLNRSESPFENFLDIELIEFSEPRKSLAVTAHETPNIHSGAEF